MRNKNSHPNHLFNNKTMKKFKHLALLLLAAVVVFGCSKYDDTELKNNVSDLQSRVEKLEKWCDTANGQITSLQGLITALQGNDYVTGVTPVMEGTTEVGYTISFTKSQPITIMHGKDGANGVTPIIGVAKHTDGLYYWTIQTGSDAATWMKDADDNMIPTTGKDGTVGQKPVISIEKDGDRYYWKVDGEWLKDASGNKVPATGDKGDTGAAGSNGAQGDKGDSFFKSVTPDAAKGTVVIKLANDTEFTLPMLSTTVSFEAYTPLQIAATGTETDVKVILLASLKKADFAAIKADITNVAGTNSTATRTAAEKWTVALIAPTFKADGTLDAQPKVTVTVPSSALEGETALLEVTLVDTKGNKSTSTRVLYYSNQVAVTGVALDNATLTVKAGKTGTLTATIAPADASNQTVTWTSSDKTVATVTAGTVTGVKAGTATITATTEDGGFTATCAVTVKNIDVETITLTDATVSIGDKKTLTATIAPTDATIQTVTWSSSNTAIATINATTGEVTAVAKGETTITATSTSNTTVTATCKVTVEEKPSITWAEGNLVANGANGAKVGTATDSGLFFQFGSLIGWSETGSPTIAVKPANFNGKEGWAETGKIWQGTEGTVPFTVAGSGSADEKAGVGDPCRYYLGDTWRLPTKDEYVTLFGNNGYSSGAWSWNATSKSATNSTLNLAFPASGYRSNYDGSVSYVGAYGSFWSASPYNASYGYSLIFNSSVVNPSNSYNRAYGLPVRCVQEK